MAPRPARPQNVNSVAENGWNALHFAVARGHLEIALTLARAGTNLAHANNAGVTPRTLAQNWGGDGAQAALVEKLDVIHENRRHIRRHPARPPARPPGVPYARRWASWSLYRF